MRRIGLALIITLASLPIAVSAQVTVGVDEGGNAFPFGGTFTNLHPTVYQEIYNATAFTGPINIGTVKFFNEDEISRPMNTMTFTLSFSTTTKGLDVDGPGGISSTNFNGNDGPDNTLFGTFSIGGPAPSVLSFTGTPYLYNPAHGNLLLDLRVVSFSPTGDASFQDNRFSNDDEVSRATDWGTGTTDFGLVTEFDSPAATVPTTVTPEPATASLLGAGLAVFGGLRAGRRRRRRTS